SRKETRARPCSSTTAFGKWLKRSWAWGQPTEFRGWSGLSSWTPESSPTGAAAGSHSTVRLLRNTRPVESVRIEEFVGRRREDGADQPVGIMANEVITTNGYQIVDDHIWHQPTYGVDVCF